MIPARARKELILAASLLAFGLLVLPVAVYLVGQQVVGEYPAEGGVWTLALDLWGDAIRGQPLALLLVLAPYGIFQLLRAAVRLFAGQSTVQ